MFFGFWMKKDSWDEIDDEIVCMLIEVELFDVLLVIFFVYF